MLGRGRAGRSWWGVASAVRGTNSNRARFKQIQAAIFLYLFSCIHFVSIPLLLLLVRALCAWRPVCLYLLLCVIVLSFPRSPLCCALVCVRANIDGVRAGLCVRLARGGACSCTGGALCAPYAGRGDALLRDDLRRGAPAPACADSRRTGALCRWAGG